MGEVVACGIDIVEIAEIKRLCARYGQRFLRRVLCGSELSIAEGRPDTARFIAGRFAAKEAVLKVLGVGIFQGVPLTEFEIGSRPSGEPICVLLGRAAERARERGVDQVLVSISHSDKFAVAQALGIKVVRNQK